MSYLSDEVAAAVEALGIHAHRLARNDADRLRRRVGARYGLDPRNLLWGTACEGAEVIHDPMAWSWLDDFVPDSAVYLLFHPFADSDVWVLPDGHSLARVIGECSGFWFYACSEEAEYLLCYDDHDCLIGLGTATDWIRTLRRKRSSGPQEPDA
jgi:hypothetical protein